MTFIILTFSSRTANGLNNFMANMYILFLVHSVSCQVHSSARLHKLFKYILTYIFHFWFYGKYVYTLTYLEAEIWMFYIEFIFSYTVFRAKCTLQRDYIYLKYIFHFWFYFIWSRTKPFLAAGFLSLGYRTMFGSPPVISLCRRIDTDHSISLRGYIERTVEDS